MPVPRSRILEWIAAAIWLPYADLHYAHSAHPAVRWSYLPALERRIDPPHFTPAALLLGKGSDARRHLHALTRTTQQGLSMTTGTAPSSGTAFTLWQMPT
ncbi:TDP-N-acetylfucosamine:lipid II N-acetylfucosaminyltransferase [Streptomyces sp. NBC_01142]|uniref:hypothetical protein n=1 Tax=Streptomyces sp. NBC_01142 TaxID=2975865 RepID=UPI00225BCC1C|nr:hypothetical protein [Streptomyces sp. NBC_01142]MCX4821550.1 TDP-N-acetylfucosamine:lipid II N-acetylfucosaminyltransferase [Streptomyces sp. NBC_01142]